MPNSIPRVQIFSYKRLPSLSVSHSPARLYPSRIRRYHAGRGACLCDQNDTPELRSLHASAESQLVLRSLSGVTDVNTSWWKISIVSVKVPKPSKTQQTEPFFGETDR